MVIWFTIAYLPIAHMVWFWMGPDAYTAAEVVDAMNAKAGQEVALLEEATVVPSGVVRLVELQEAGYTYIRP